MLQILYMCMVETKAKRTFNVWYDRHAQFLAVVLKTNNKRNKHSSRLFIEIIRPFCEAKTKTILNLHFHLLEYLPY